MGRGVGRGARYLGRSIEWMRHDFYELIRLGEAACVPDRCSDAAAFIASRSMPIDNLHYVGLFHSLSSRSKTTSRRLYGKTLFSGVAFCLLTEQ